MPDKPKTFESIDPDKLEEWIARLNEIETDMVQTLPPNTYMQLRTPMKYLRGSLRNFKRTVVKIQQG